METHVNPEFESNATDARDMSVKGVVARIEAAMVAAAEVSRSTMVLTTAEDLRTLLDLLKYPPVIFQYEAGNLQDYEAVKQAALQMAHNRPDNVVIAPARRDQCPYAIERLGLQLAAVHALAAGVGRVELTPQHESWSPAYEATRRLRMEAEKLTAENVVRGNDVIAKKNMQTETKLRVIIGGGPKAGKTTFANSFMGVAIKHTDSLMGKMNWSAVSEQIASDWMQHEGPWVIEGVAVVRAIRKWLKAHPEGKPCDILYYLNSPHVPLSTAQESMRKGCLSVWREIQDELTKRGVDIRHHI